MGLNVSKGNMYGFVTDTFNIIKGKCPHRCTYCYMGQERLNPPRIDEKEFNTDLEEGKFIFAGSSIDVFAYGIPTKWIRRFLGYLSVYNKNKYLLQTKNPARYLELKNKLISENYIYCTTIETNRFYPQMGVAPDPAGRASAMKRLSELGYKTMVTVEPIMDFDLGMLQLYIEACRPEWVNIGADSKRHNLPEPPKDKILKLIDVLKKSGIKVINKSNLKRLL